MALETIILILKCSIISEKISNEALLIEMHHWEILRGVRMPCWINGRAAISILRGFCHIILLLLLIKVEMSIILGWIDRHRTICDFLSASHAISDTSLSCKSWRLPGVRYTPFFIWSGAIRILRSFVWSAGLLSDRYFPLIQEIPPFARCVDPFRLILDFDRTHPLSEVLVLNLRHLIALKISVR